jgi:hypothetical protein
MPHLSVDLYNDSYNHYEWDGSVQISVSLQAIIGFIHSMPRSNYATSVHDKIYHVCLLHIKSSSIATMAEYPTLP